MSIQKTIENPASYRITVDVPREMPVGPIILTFAPAPAASQKPIIPGEDNEDGLNLHPTAEQVTAAMAGVGKGTVQPSYDTLEEVLAAAEQRREAEKADPSLRSLKHWHGILKDSKAWGAHLDTNAEIRKMRDEWPDYWDVKNGNT
ncbi:hypothetical protein [Treponema primitia]|uniref:hypothetical protein n=1 Tax=Treponema primitia TaxID=88058 RepID=UPI0002555494|nr:hypothetical protein [Treponema primitia]